MIQFLNQRYNRKIFKNRLLTAPEKDLTILT